MTKETKVVGAMTITLERISSTHGRTRQDEILDELNMTRDEMRARAGAFELDARERGLAREYERLEFLLADDE